ncbi:MAG: cupin domain-containing protein [Oceanicaulis sp.]
MNAMTTINDTLLDDGWMLDAASGAAPSAVRVLATCHAAMNPAAGRTLDAAEAAFGALLESGPRAPMQTGALASILSRLGDAPAEPEPRQAPVELPAPLARAFAASRQTSWRRRIGGYGEIVLDTLEEPGVRARLLSIPPGKGSPEHDHGGEELTLVLSGAIRDGDRMFARGDVLEGAPGRPHRPRVEGAETCVCFAVELGDLKLTNPIYAFADRLLGRRFTH